MYVRTIVMCVISVWCVCVCGVCFVSVLIACLCVCSMHVVQKYGVCVMWF